MAITEPREWFDKELPETVKANPGKIEGFEGTLLFTITGDKGGNWTVDIRNKELKVTQEQAANPDITITMKDSDFVDFINKKLSGQMAFMTGKLKFKGNMQLAMKLQGLL